MTEIPFETLDREKKTVWSRNPKFLKGSLFPFVRQTLFTFRTKEKCPTERAFAAAIVREKDFRDQRHILEKYLKQQITEDINKLFRKEQPAYRIV